MESDSRKKKAKKNKAPNCTDKKRGEGTMDHAATTALGAISNINWTNTTSLHYLHPSTIGTTINRFNIKEDVTGHTQVKSSVQRAIRAKILEQYKEGIEGIIDDVMPKKAPLILMKWYVAIFCGRVWFAICPVECYLPIIPFFFVSY